MPTDFECVEAVIDHRIEQRNSVKGKDTPIRVEFRYRYGTKHYQYFTDLESAKTATDHLAGYGMTGRAVIESPLSQQIQVRGPRGGWKVWRDA
jgi:hypothetical protein